MVLIWQSTTNGDKVENLAVIGQDCLSQPVTQPVWESRTVSKKVETLQVTSLLYDCAVYLVPSQGA